MNANMKVLSFALVENNNKYLLICEASNKWRGRWFLPGGRVEKGEEPDHAAVRETKEEAGCSIVVKGLFFFRCISSFLKNKMHLFYNADPLDNNIKTYPDKHSLEARWFTIEEIRKLPLRSNALEVIESYHRSKALLPLENLKIIDRSAEPKPH